MMLHAHVALRRARTLILLSDVVFPFGLVDRVAISALNRILSRGLIDLLRESIVHVLDEVFSCLIKYQLTKGSSSLPPLLASSVICL